MYVLIDNYDSFVHNLRHYLEELGARVQTFRNDALTPDEVLAMNPEGIILSPGPCNPERAGICLSLVKKAAGRVPILGVCLGHQAIGQGFGGRVVRAHRVMHGKTSPVLHEGDGIFEGLPSPFRATRYHSLILERKSLPSEVAMTAFTEDGIVMGIRHVKHPVFGVQFHPESIASEHGHDLLANFLRLAREANPS